MPPKASAETMTDSSRARVARGVDVLHPAQAPSASAPSAIGSTRMNIQRQSR